VGDRGLPPAVHLWSALIGLATGTIYYPVFLLPLWCSFYWQRGIRQVRGSAIAAALAGARLRPLVHIPRLHRSLWASCGRCSAGSSPTKSRWKDSGRSPFNDAVFRLPVLAAFVAMISTLAIWPAPKNLGTLMSCTAGVLLLGSQFWKAHNGGLFMAWFLPVLLLVVFRPNLENRVAMLVLTAEWFPRRRAA
jgi:hypothetical protein